MSHRHKLYGFSFPVSVCWLSFSRFSVAGLWSHCYVLGFLFVGSSIVLSYMVPLVVCLGFLL